MVHSHGEIDKRKRSKNKMLGTERREKGKKEEFFRQRTMLSLTHGTLPCVVLRTILL
jgi:hypothetical protein